MATKTIDKLRIQGNAAPRRGPEIRRPFHHPVFHDTDAPSHFIIQTDTGSVVTGSDITTIVNSHPSSAASRKHDHLQRVQQANKGLTSAEVGSIGREGLPRIHFLLRGKPVQGDVEVTTIDTLKHQRVGHYKTSAKEVYRARHKVASDLSSSGDHTNVFRAIRTPFNESTDVNFAYNNNSNNNSNNGVGPGNFFYLGPSVSGHTLHQTWPTKRGMGELTTSAHSLLTHGSHRDAQSRQNNNNNQNNYNHNDAIAWYENNDGSETGKYLTFSGQPYPTPRGSPQGEELVDINGAPYLTNASKHYTSTHSMTDVLNVNPTTASSRQRQTSTRSRRNNREASQFKSDYSSLNECLSVHKSHKIPLKTDISPRDIVRLKHCPQAKVNYNNPYRNLRSKDRKDAASNAGRYIFNSVESYIHFNKIYPRSSDMQSQSDLASSQKSRILGNLPNIPRVNGFTSHCTDTVLLKMMFEMNKPKSVKSISRYSDVAVHKDLDEFMIVSTPTVSRSPSVASRKTTMGQKSKSQVSFVSGHREEDEEDIENDERKEQNFNPRRDPEVHEEEPPQHDLVELEEKEDETKTGSQNVLKEVEDSTDGQMADGEAGRVEDVGQPSQDNETNHADVENES